MRLRTINEALQINDDIIVLICDWLNITEEELPDFKISYIPTSEFNSDDIENEILKDKERDVDYAMEVDLSQPIVLWNDKLVDGFHRLYKAHKQGIKSLPYIDLSQYSNENPPDYLYSYK